MQKMWSGRFKEASSKLLEEFNASINFDKNLFFQDINGSIAHASMLGKCGILDKDDVKKIIDGLNKILKEIQENKFSFKIEDEDIHMAIEKRLSEIIGSDLGGRLHTARSRNDQVALDFRMFVLKEFNEISNLVLNLIQTLLKKAKNHKDTIMPGFTHLQHAQPVSFAYHLLAYCFMFKRDIQRLRNSFDRNNFSPLGCAALAGTPHKIDRFEVANALGFKGVTSNCMDTVSDRDFALELLFDISLIFTHTSRLCEELILWSSQEFMFVSMSDKFSTGSSIMPQKKNPDVAELIRGKTGRVYGNLMALLTTMKSLPLAYNKDMQEDKEGVFDSVKTAHSSLVILNDMIESMSINSENMLKACKKGHLTATDLADFLVRVKNIPFRKAHFITGKCVALAESKGVDLSELSCEELKNIDENIDKDAMQVLNLNSSKEARNSIGGTANSSIESQILELEEFLNA